MKLNLDFHFPSTSFNVPPGAVRATQWLKHGDHSKVLQDYEPGPCGDIDLDKWFVVNGETFTDVQHGDWIIDMNDGSTRVLRLKQDTPETIVKRVFKQAQHEYEF